MNSDFTQVRNFLEQKGRPVFYSPVNDISFTIRVRQMERLITQLWFVGDAMGISMGQKPTFISCHKSEFFTPTLLADVNELYREVIALYFTLGIASSAERAFQESFKTSPDFHKVIEDIYADEEEDEGIDEDEIK
jgi:hypothetical protein